MTLYTYKATVTDVVDGDTVDVTVDLGLRVSVAMRLRVAGINAPELSTMKGLAARAKARELLPTGLAVEIQTYYPTGQGDKYGRWLADFTLPDGTSFAHSMLDGGFAVPWDGQGPKPV